MPSVTKYHIDPGSPAGVGERRADPGRVPARHRSRGSHSCSEHLGQRQGKGECLEAR